MAVFEYIVSIECETLEQADIVIAERLDFDEDYGFIYSLDWDDYDMDDIEIVRAW